MHGQQGIFIDILLFVATFYLYIYIYTAYDTKNDQLYTKTIAI